MLQIPVTSAYVPVSVSCKTANIYVRVFLVILLVNLQQFCSKLPKVMLYSMLDKVGSYKVTSSIFQFW